MNKYKSGQLIEIDFDKEINQGHLEYPSNDKRGKKIIRQIARPMEREVGEKVYLVHSYMEPDSLDKLYSLENRGDFWHYSESDLDKYFKVVKEYDDDIRLLKYYQDQRACIGYSGYIPPKKTRKYLPTLSDLVDRLTITQQKEIFIPEHREEYTKEIEDIMYDIDLILSEYNSNMTAAMVRHIIILTHMNTWIWQNESNFRKGIKDGNDLELTHGLNGIRNTAKNKLQEVFGGRKDYKIDNVEVFKQWIPSGYEKI